MATLNPYLNFYGRCKEAMNVYKEIFGGELSIQIAGDSPAKDHMPKELHDQVMHSHLKSDTIEIMASDMAPTQPVEGNTVEADAVELDTVELDTVEARTIESRAGGGSLGERGDQRGGDKQLLEHDTLLSVHAKRRLSLHTQSTQLRDHANRTEGSPPRRGHRFAAMILSGRGLGGPQ